MGIAGRRLIRVVVLLVGTFLLLGTWHFLFRFVAALTEGLLVPWDTTPIRPPIGSWARALNDLFEAPPGSYLPSIGAVGMSAALFTIRVAKARHRTLLPMAFASTNLAFLVLDSVAVILAWRLPGLWLSQPADPGYHRTWPGIAASVVLLALLYWCQWKMPSMPFRRWTTRQG